MDVSFLLTHRVIEVLLASMLIPKIALCLIVVIAFGKKFVSFLLKGNNSPTEWLIIGICLNFIGLFCDACFWVIAISIDLMDRDYLSKLRAPIFYLNTYIRVLFTIMAAICHINSAIQHSKENEGNLKLTHKSFSIILLTSVLTGFSYAYFLISAWI